MVVILMQKIELATKREANTNCKHCNFPTFLWNRFGDFLELESGFVFQ